MVENNPQFINTVVPLFLSQHDVLVTPTVQEAVEALQTQTFDVLLIDYDLDDGKGIAVVSWARASLSTFRAIAISSHASGNQALLAAGAHAVCSKMQFHRIQHVIAKMMGG